MIDVSTMRNQSEPRRIRQRRAQSRTDAETKEETTQSTPQPIQPKTPSANLPDIEIHSVLEKENPEKVWANIPYNELFQTINLLYDEVVFYQRNLFKIPSGKCGKEFTAELAFWLRQFNNNSKLNGIAIYLPLMLQKPSAKSKAKQQSAALERRLKSMEGWRN